MAKEIQEWADKCAEQVMQEVCPIETWTCEADRQKQWAKRSSSLSRIISQWMQAAIASHAPEGTGQYQPEECSICGKEIGPTEEYQVYLGHEGIRLYCHTGEILLAPTTNFTGRI